MKISYKETSQFKPFQFCITFETESECNEFWHRLNCSNDNIKRSAKALGLQTIFNDEAFDQLFKRFDNIYRPEKEK